MATRPWLRLYALVAVPLCVLYVALPDPPRYLWTAIGLLSLAGLVVGTVVNNPRRRLPWWLATAGVSSFDWFISISLVPLSYALTAPAAAAWGVRETLVGAGLLGAVVTFAFLFVPGVRMPDLRLATVPA